MIFPPRINPVLHGLGELVLGGEEQEMAVRLENLAAPGFEKNTAHEEKETANLEAHVYLAEGAALGHDGAETLAQRANLVHLIINLRRHQWNQRKGVMKNNGGRESAGAVLREHSGKQGCGI